MRLIWNFSRMALSLAMALGLLSAGISSVWASQDRPHWMTALNPLPQETFLLVVKGVYQSRSEAERVQKFITQLMGTTPPDQVDVTDHYEGLPPGKYFIGMLFDSQERAKWWIDFSYRNRQVPKGEIHRVKLKQPSVLPYMPDAVREGKKRLLSSEEAIHRVRSLQDVQRLSQDKALIYKITDYPRNGDLRYEVEILEAKGKHRDPIMVDFVMVSAINGEITERLSAALGQGITSKSK